MNRLLVLFLLALPYLSVSQWTCGDSVAYQGYNYATVQIGGQCWFAENCRYLPSVSPQNSGSNSSPYYYVVRGWI